MCLIRSALTPPGSSCFRARAQRAAPKVWLKGYKVISGINLLLFCGFIPDYLVFFVFFTRLPGFHKKCTRLPGVPSRGGQITWFLQNLHQITWSPQSGGTRLPGPLLAIKWTRLPGKTRLPGGAKRGPEYLVSTKKGPDYLGAAPIGLTRAARVPGALYPRAVWPLLPPPHHHPIGPTRGK